MKIRFTVGIVAALALTACGGQTKPAADTSGVSATSGTSAAVAASSEVATTSPAAPAKGEQPSREFLIGKWGTDGDCTLAIELRPDGTSDGPFGCRTLKKTPYSLMPNHSDGDPRLNPGAM